MNWPYGPAPESFLDPPAPSWECPHDQCDCRDIEQTDELYDFTVVLLAKSGERMPGARCRVHHLGRLLNEGAPNADGDGCVRLKLPRKPITLIVEWAPADTPVEPQYPYRARYYADLGESREQAGRRRLSNLGFWTERTLADNVSAYQRHYLHPRISGVLEDIETELVWFHDTGSPPITPEDESEDFPPLDTPLASDGAKGFADPDRKGAPAVSPAAGKAKTAAAPPDTQAKPPITPQPPIAPGPNPGAIKVPSTAVQIDLRIDWGSRPGRSGSAARQPSSSFWLRPTVVPVRVGVIDLFRDWPTVPFAEEVAAVRNAPSDTFVTATLPAGHAMIRLEFDLQVTIGGFTKTVLAFRQLFYLYANGDLVPARFAFADYSYAKGTQPAGSTSGRRGAPPVRVTGKGEFVDKGFRRGYLQHPLLAMGATLSPPSKPAGKRKGPVPRNQVPRLTREILINAEMVDATDLWWANHPEEDVEQYLDPSLGGRPEFLRVLAWTSGKLPMIWFCAVPDGALRTSDDEADIVFFRPPPEANSFTHKPNEAAFVHQQHHAATAQFPGKPTTMWMLSRFLLSSQPLTALKAAGVTDPNVQTWMADAVLPTVPRDAAGKIVPALPAPHIKQFIESFRVCGLEQQLNQSDASCVLYLPLASEHDGYPGAVRAGLKTLIESAYLCLWNQCAVLRDVPMAPFTTDLDNPAPKIQTPDPKRRKLWIAGHSAGNLSMGGALGTNALDVDRMMGFAVVKAKGILGTVQANLDSASRQRKAAGKTPVEAFLITAPDLTQVWIRKKAATGPESIRGVSMDVAIARRLFNSGATVTFLPPFDKQLEHYTLSPASAMGPVLRRLVGAWNNAEVETSAKNPGLWHFLFFHEYPMHGGDQGKPFFLQALGPPQPLPAAPKKLPP